MPDCAEVTARYIINAIKAVKDGKLGSWNLEDLSFKDLGEDIHEGYVALLMRLITFVKEGESANLHRVDDAIQPGGSFHHIADTTKRPTIYNQALPHSAPSWTL